MAEVEIAGAKIKGGKILLILPILGTLGGGLWGGFEFYKDYMNMREKIEEYSAPDLSGFDKKLAVLKAKAAKPVLGWMNLAAKRVAKKDSKLKPADEALKLVITVVRVL